MTSALAAGCSADRPADAAKDSTPPVMPMEETVYGEQVRQLNKAREQARQMERRMDDLNERLAEDGQ